MTLIHQHMVNITSFINNDEKLSFTFNCCCMGYLSACGMLFLLLISSIGYMQYIFVNKLHQRKYSMNQFQYMWNYGWHLFNLLKLWSHLMVIFFFLKKKKLFHLLFDGLCSMQLQHLQLRRKQKLQSFLGNFHWSKFSLCWINLF